MSAPRTVSTPLVLVLLLLVALPAQSAPRPVSEEFQYRWRLTSFLGRIAGLFLPGRGEGLLTYRTNEAGNLVSQLEITSEKSDEGEFWLYGAEIDPRSDRTVRAWSAYRFRDKDKVKRSPVGEEGVVDVASGILQIRQDPPRKPRRMRIWSDGKVYPVEVLPQGDDLRRVGMREVETRHFLIRGLEEENERLWEGKLELWLLKDEVATPAAILIYRKGIGVLLEIQEP